MYYSNICFFEGYDSVSGAPLEDGDILGAEMMSDKVFNFGPNTLIVHLLACSDSASFTSTSKKMSLTPISWTILNLPPSMRTLFEAILIPAVFPPDIVDFHRLLEQVLEGYSDCLMGSRTCGEGFEVFDGDTKQQIHVRLNIIADVEDSRGLTNALGCKQAPAIVGGCPFCTIKGHRFYNQTTYYLGSSIQ